MKSMANALLGVSTLLVLGCGGRLPSSATVQGTVVDKNSGAPVAGVNIQLIDTAFTPATDVEAFGGSYEALSTANQKAIVGKATTGKDGTYRMDGLSKGIYAVCPYTANAGQQIHPVGNPAEPATVHLDRNTGRVDFTLENLTRVTPPFSITVTFNGLPPGTTRVTPNRRYWALFIPFFNTNASNYSLSFNLPTITWDLTQDTPDANQLTLLYGHGRLGIPTIDNCWYFDLDTPQGLKRTSLLYMPLLNTPSASRWSYDVATRTFTRLDPPPPMPPPIL